MSQENDTPANSTPVNPYGPSEIDTAVEAFISTAQKDFTPEPEAEVDAPAVIESKQAEGVQENSVPQPPEDPAARGLERLVAREVELRAREEKLTGAEKEIETLRSRLSELEQRPFLPELVDKIRLSPADGLRALGLDPDEVVRAALAEKLGDKAPPEMRDILERGQTRKEIAALRAQVAENERRAMAQAYYTQISNGAREFVTQPEGLSKHAPTVATVAKGNPERVYQEIMEEITRDAQVRSQREPTGDIIPYEEAARRVEARWSAMRALFGSGAPETPSVPPASTPTPETKQNVAVSTPKSTTIKPPEKPLAPWLQRNDDLEAGIRAGIDEWKRSLSKER